ncbi:hypothetical protein Gotur_030417, partial [Gossypium turneri]
VADDYNRVLTQGPWIIYGQYLTLYKRKIIEATGGLIGKVVKLDVQTDNQTRGRLSLTVLSNGSNMNEALPTVCFSCGKYENVKETCPSVATDKNPVLNRDESSIGVALPNGGSIDDETTGSRSREKEPEFGP